MHCSLARTQKKMHLLNITIDVVQLYVLGHSIYITQCYCECLFYPAVYGAD